MRAQRNERNNTMHNHHSAPRNLNRRRADKSIEDTIYEALAGVTGVDVGIDTYGDDDDTATVLLTAINGGFTLEVDVDATMTPREIREAISDAAYEWDPHEAFEEAYPEYAGAYGLVHAVDDSEETFLSVFEPLAY